MIKRSCVSLAMGIVCALGTIESVLAQTPASPAFEVASVKPNNSGPQQAARFTMPAGDRLTAINMPLLALIQEAYSVTRPRLAGGPGWISGDRFDITAKAMAPTSVVELRLMLRALLEERFGLVVHTETLDAATYALVIARRDAKLGPNLHPASIDCATLRASARKAAPGGRLTATPCGIQMQMGRLSARGMDLAQLAAMLSTQVGQPVVDKTGIVGNFDWNLTFTPLALLQVPPSDRTRCRLLTPTHRPFLSPSRNSSA